MSKRRQHSREVRESGKKYREQIRSWRQHPDDPWAELERMGLTEAVLQLGWSQPRVTRAMNSVASEERFRLKVHRAFQEESDRPLFMGGGVGRPGAPEEDHGYTRDPEHALDPDAEVIDLPTLNRLNDESAEKRTAVIGEYVAAMENLRGAFDDLVKERPGLTRIIGRELWQVRGRIDAAKAKLKDRMVA